MSNFPLKNENLKPRRTPLTATLLNIAGSVFLSNAK
jgi:hypothetical protein